MLSELPDEVLLHIFSFLASRHLLLAIPGVCKRLSGLVDTPWYWRTRFVQLCQAQPLTELGGLRRWQEACTQRELALAVAKKAANQSVLQGMM